ncbi:MAG TPA: TetR/AcrR family transcriptional regulator [Acidimicrobiales bacterium]|nr:TetR/AcrR family transcriptional regulator [Acidimicrobiales bacterium]
MSAGARSEVSAGGAAEPPSGATDWERRVVGRSLDDARRRSIDRGARLIRAAATVLERTNGESLTVQDVADEAGQSLRTLYQYFSSKDDLLLAVFEEAMRTYATLIRGAIAELTDPVERLSGAVIAAARMPALHRRSGVDRGLSHLRLQLTQAEPELVARSQEPVTAVYRELVAAALASADPPVVDVEVGTYLLSALRQSVILSLTWGNEYGTDLPDAIDLSCFSLAGLGLARPRRWHEAVDARLELSGADGRSILRRLAKAGPVRG